MQQRTTFIQANFMIPPAPGIRLDGSFESRVETLHKLSESLQQHRRGAPTYKTSKEYLLNFKIRYVLFEVLFNT